MSIPPAMGEATGLAEMESPEGAGMRSGGKAAQRLCFRATPGDPTSGTTWSPAAACSSDVAGDIGTGRSTPVTQGCDSNSSAVGRRSGCFSRSRLMRSRAEADIVAGKVTARQAR